MATQQATARTKAGKWGATEDQIEASGLSAQKFTYEFVPSIKAEIEIIRQSCQVGRGELRSYILQLSFL